MQTPDIEGVPNAELFQLERSFVNYVFHSKLILRVEMIKFEVLMIILYRWVSRIEDKMI